MLMTHLGSGIWSYTRRITGAIFFDSRPATIITSACRGLARNTSLPKRAMSLRALVDCIVSSAQHARPKVTGYRLWLRPQATSLPSVPNRMPSRSSSWKSFSNRSVSATTSPPVQDAAAEDVDVAHSEDRDEDHGVEEQVLGRGLEAHGQRVEERGLEVEDDEQHRDQVEVDREALASAAGRDHARLVRLQHRGRALLLRAQQHGDREGGHADEAGR